ncbi:hypothetical protein [Spirosoma fluminis]
MIRNSIDRNRLLFLSGEWSGQFGTLTHRLSYVLDGPERAKYGDSADDFQ